jgi:hypothetical protein
MNSAGNVLAEAVGQGEHGNSRDDKLKSQSFPDYKKHFLELKAKTLSSVALAEDASEAAIVSSAVRFFNLLRESRVTAYQLEFSIHTEANKP